MSQNNVDWSSINDEDIVDELLEEEGEIMLDTKDPPVEGMEEGEIIDSKEELNTKHPPTKRKDPFTPCVIRYALGPAGYRPKRPAENEPTYDLFCCRKTTIYPHSTIAVPLGIQFLNLNYPSWGEILTRPGLSTVHSLDVVPGSLIRPNSLKFIAVSIRNHSNKVYTFAQGEPIAKLKINPNPWCTLVEEKGDEKKKVQKSFS